tara:strand:- start:4190 stop:5047 length:858 start_codon:yes stop_codon:yes gene_type:complete
MALMLLGCAEKKESSPAVNGGNGVGAGQVPGEAPPKQDGGSNFQPNDTGWGTPAPFTITDMGNFKDFTGGSFTPDLNSTKLYYKVEKVGNRYKATFRLYYRYSRTIGGIGPNAGQKEYLHYAPKFESGNTSTDIQYNTIYQRNGKDYWVGFAEEKVYDPNTDTYSDFVNFNDSFGGPASFGSIVVVLDSQTESGFTWSGKVYYRNFRYSSNIGTASPDKPSSENVNYKCWNIKAGPYECREFLESNYPFYDMLVVQNGQVKYDLENPYFYTELGEVDNIFIPPLN